MKVLINAAATGTGGARTFLLNLLRALTEAEPSHEYLVLLGALGDESLFTTISSRVRVLPESRRAPRLPTLRVLWEQFAVPGFVRCYRPDVLVSAGSMDVFLARALTGVPSIVVVQVNQPWVVPELMPDKFRNWYLRNGVRLSGKTATRLITTSETARQELHDYLGVPLEKVVAIHHGGAPEHFCPEAAANVAALERHGLSKPYLLSVSSIFTFKNYHRLIEAYALLTQRRPDLPALVIVGGVKHANYFRQLQSLVAEKQLRERVRFLAHIGHDDLPAIYANAELYVFPSLCETFGMTQTEAMACGVPVLAGEVSVNPEICGDAALYFDPRDPASIAAAIERALYGMDESQTRPDALRARLREAGLKRANMFTWERAAEGYLEVFESV